MSFHILLHIPQSIKHAGPPYVYWQFGIERKCGIIAQKVKSGKMPYANLTNNIDIDIKLNLISYIPLISEVLKSKYPDIQDQTEISSRILIFTIDSYQGFKLYRPSNIINIDDTMLNYLAKYY